MITTEKEYVGSKKAYDSGLNTIKNQTAEAEKNGFTKEQIKLVNDPTESFILGIKDEIMEYEQIKMGNIPEHFFEFENIGLLLIALRIKHGFTQSELARRLKVPQSQVCRDERNDYRGVSVITVNKLLKIYGEDLSLKLKNRE
jgi:DNA-binding XRE family transcriptional regulator